MAQRRATTVVRLSTYFGGLNGDGYVAIVRKVGGDWIVVEMRMECIS